MLDGHREWVSVQSSREAAEHQLEIEADELDSFPDGEHEELRLIYRARGLPDDEAATPADSLIEDRETALDCARRLGIDPDELGGSLVVAAVSSFLLFAVGHRPGAALHGHHGQDGNGRGGRRERPRTVPALGAATTVITGRSAVRSGARQLLIGWASAAVTYGLGAAIGVTLG